MALGFCMTSVILAQNSRKNLTTILRELSLDRKAVISFSSTFTDEIYPHDSSMKGDLSHILTNLLKGSRLSFKQLKNGHYLIFKRKEIVTLPKKKEKKTVKPVVDTLPPIVIPMADFYIPVFRDTAKIKFAMPVRFSLPDLSNALPRWAIKSNLLYATIATLNIGLEIGLAEKWTLDISANYNPWTFSDNRKMKHWLVQPEIRRWTCERFFGHFFGLHLHGAQFNFGGMLPWGSKTGEMFGAIKNDNILNRRYEGWLAGGGVSYGYHWIVGNRWGLEAEIGVGYAYLKYDKYPCGNCGKRMDTEHKNYFGPTKAAITLVYMIK